MLSVEIRSGDRAQTLPLPDRLVLGAAQGFPEGALELVAQGDAAVALCRAPDAQVGPLKLPAGVRRLIRPGESIRIGDAAVSLLAEQDGGPQTRILARAMLRGSPPGVRPGVPSLVWLNGPELGKRAALLEEATFIGRGEGCVARVNDSQASRMHAKLVRTPEGFRLVDLMSANGVLVDGQKLTEPRLLRGGEVLQVGNTLLAFEKPAEPKREPAPAPPSAAVPQPDPPKPPPQKADPPPPAPAREEKPAKSASKLAAFEVLLLALAVFAVGGGGLVIAWAVR